MSELYTIESLLDLSQTNAAGLFEGKTYPWEVLPEIKNYILNVLIPSLDPDKYDSYDNDVYVAKTAKVAPTAYIGGPCVIGEETEVRHGAFIRGSAIIGNGCVVGNSTEIKNAVVFNSVQIPHYNYVGDSVLGYHSHMGAGSITANVKADKSNVVIRGEETIETGLRKMGAVLGDFADVGCNSVLTPGVIIGRKTNIYPLSMVRGCIKAGSIYKNKGEIVEKISAQTD